MKEKLMSCHVFKFGFLWDDMSSYKKKKKVLFRLNITPVRLEVAAGWHIPAAVLHDLVEQVKAAFSLSGKAPAGGALEPVVFPLGFMLVSERACSRFYLYL